MKSTLVETPQSEGGGGLMVDDRAKKPAASGFQNHLELRLGISPNNGNKDMVTTTSSSTPSHYHRGFSATPRPDQWLLLHHNKWFSEPSGSSFVHPWSLAARQQKAVFEKAHQQPNPTPPSTVQSATHHSPVVGWPPIRAFRKNLTISPAPPKLEMEGEKYTKRARTSNDASDSTTEATKESMFVKVNMEGYAVGRKIDLKAHNSYDSLSRTLQRMFNNFLSANYSTNSEQDERDDAPNTDYLLIYEDHEGDRMLVGDVPWEMFFTSVKRLYIAHSGSPSNSSRSPAANVDEERVTDHKH